MSRPPRPRAALTEEAVFRHDATAWSSPIRQLQQGFEDPEVHVPPGGDRRRLSPSLQPPRPWLVPAAAAARYCQRGPCRAASNENQLAHAPNCQVDQAWM